MSILVRMYTSAILTAALCLISGISAKNASTVSTQSPCQTSLASHVPKELHCGSQGFIKCPSSKNITYHMSGNSSAFCQQTCLDDPTCQSFSWNSVSQDCMTYTKTASSQCWYNSTTTKNYFWNRRCFDISCPEPQTHSVCPKSKPHAGYSDSVPPDARCNTGFATLPDAQYLLEETAIIGPAAVYCAEKCLNNPMCLSFAVNRTQHELPPDTDHSPACYLYSANVSVATHDPWSGYTIYASDVSCYECAKNLGCDCYAPIASTTANASCGIIPKPHQARHSYRNEISTECTTGARDCTIECMNDHRCASLSFADGYLEPKNPGQYLSDCALYAHNATVIAEEDDGQDVYEDGNSNRVPVLWDKSCYVCTDGYGSENCQGCQK